MIDHIDYAHPVFDAAAVRPSVAAREINGIDGTYFCGAYWGYGFHEDGVQSALEVARHFGVHAVRSASYEGALVHHAPAARATGSARAIAMPLLDLDEIDEVVAQHPLWSRSDQRGVVPPRATSCAGPRPTTRRSATSSRREVGRRPSGPIAMLAHVRTWGWLFNPIAAYYCYDPTATRVEHAVAE